MSILTQFRVIWYQSLFAVRDKDKAGTSVEHSLISYNVCRTVPKFSDLHSNGFDYTLVTALKLSLSTTSSLPALRLQLCCFSRAHFELSPLCRHHHADDICIKYVGVSKSRNDTAVSSLHSALSAVHFWFSQNGLIINPDKSESLIMVTDFTSLLQLCQRGQICYSIQWQSQNSRD